MSDNEKPKSKIWNENVMIEGGCSYYTLVSEGKKYRVSLTSKGKDIKILKWRIRTASDEIFSVSSKSMAEAQQVIDCLFGKNMYKVSQMLL